MFTQTIEMNDVLPAECYQAIAGETLNFLVISSQLLSGSKISKSTYKQVVFSDCTFHACEFQGVSFENCIFENCSFEFSHFRKSSFKNCNFSNCNWKASSSIKCIYVECDLASLQSKISSENNTLSFETSEDHSTDIYIELVLAA